MRKNNLITVTVMCAILYLVTAAILFTLLFLPSKACPVETNSFKAAIDGDYRTVAGMEVVKNCLFKLGCIVEAEEIIKRELTIEHLERSFKQ